MFVFVISNFMKSSTVYAARLCTSVRFGSMIRPSIRFDISLQNRKKIFNYEFGCRKKTLSDFLASKSSSLKKAHTGRPA